MPPRFAYWTIILEGAPTAFRAQHREDLLPTLKQLQGKHPDAQMQWFARGRLWSSPEEAQAARGGGERRGADWRPGGEHRDPRARFDIPRAEKRRRFAARLRGEDPRAPRPRPENSPGGDRRDAPAHRPQPRPDDRHRRPPTGGRPDDRNRRPAALSRPDDRNRPPTGNRPDDRNRRPAAPSRPDDRDRRPPAGSRPDDRRHRPGAGNRPEDRNRRPGAGSRPAWGGRPDRNAGGGKRAPHGAPKGGAQGRAKGSKPPGRGNRGRGGSGGSR